MSRTLKDRIPTHGLMVAAEEIETAGYILLSRLFSVDFSSIPVCLLACLLAKNGENLAIFQRCLNKILSIEKGAKECIV